jgi:cell division protein ZapB
MMLRELDQLAERINQLAALAQNLREENQLLRTQLSDAENNGRSLRSRLDAARQRIEALIEKLPAE